MSRRRGQAAVETALTLPLVLFMILGALQLFMVMQARILAQYAASRAVRAGAQSFGDCKTMIDVAHLVLLPAIDATFARVKSNIGNRYANDVQLRMGGNKYLGAATGGITDGTLNGPVVWFDRATPVAPFPASEEENWDLPPHKVLSVRMVFWAPLKIPFANWIFARIALAQWGARELHTADPLMPVKKDANWVAASSGPRSTDLKPELDLRYAQGQYVFPIEVWYATRMMSPARFTNQNCPR
jgi:hypothetical protein